MTGSKPVRVVVVEDSLVQRTHLVHALQAEGDIVVVGEAEGATEAIDVVGRLLPDVVTLDLLIPGGGGQHAIEQIMARNPTPILVLSGTVDSRESVPAIEALVAGAVDAIPKPGRWTASDEMAMRRTVRSLSGVTVIRHPRGGLAHRRSARPLTAHNGIMLPRSSRTVVAIAASTGGPNALATVLSGLGALTAPVLVVQHIHPDFVEGLVRWMNKVSDLAVRCARSGASLEDATVYIAPSGTHLRLGPDHQIVLDPEPVTIHRPSADELLLSVARYAGADGIGVVLTGMGEDGAAGMLELRRAGGMTIAQDAASCAVFGMPRAAERAGGVTRMVPLDEIAFGILMAERGART